MEVRLDIADDRSWLYLIRRLTYSISQAILDFSKDLDIGYDLTNNVYRCHLLTFASVHQSS